MTIDASLTHSHSFTLDEGRSRLKMPCGADQGDGGPRLGDAARRAGTAARSSWPATSIPGRSAMPSKVSPGRRREFARWSTSFTSS